ncbi:MAG: translocation/assembly module TamB [Bacteroidales bacterium]|nr:translocation/assembly module TamB [Bacteroidales bacterium]
MTREIAAYLSKELHTEISISGVNIKWIKDLTLENLIIKDRNHKSILSTKELRLDLRKINRENQQFHINHLQLIQAQVNLIRQKQDSLFNYQFLIDYFNTGTKDTTTKKPWLFRLNSLKLIDSKFTYQDQLRDTISRGVCYNNIQLDTLNLYARNLLIKNDTISADIKNVSCFERSGFQLNSLKTRVKVSSTGVEAKNLQIETPNTIATADLRFIYSRYRDYLDFINKVKIEAQIKPSEVFMEDIAWFAPAMFGMKNKLRISGVVNGTVKNLNVHDLIFFYGDSSKFYGDIIMNGLPDIENTNTKLTIYELLSNQKDIGQFKLPQEKEILIPEEFKKVGKIQLQGNFEGKYNNFLTDASCYTDIGELSAYLALRKNVQTEIIEYKGTVKALDLNLGYLINSQDYFGKMNFSAEINGKGISMQTVKANLNGTIDSLDFNGNQYNSIKIKGDLFRNKFRGMLEVNDEFINLDFAGLVDFHQKPYRFDFTSNINDARLGLLNLSNRDIESNLSTQIKTRMYGNNIDELTGKLEINNTIYYELDKEYKLDEFKLSIETDSLNTNTITVESDFIDASIYGKIKPSELIPMLNNYIFKHLPALELNNDTLYTNQEIKIRGTLKYLTPLTQLFAPDLRISRNTVFDGSFNSKTARTDLRFSGKHIEYNKLKFKDWHLIFYGDNNQINLSSGSDSLYVKNVYKNDSLLIGLKDFNILTSFNQDTINYTLDWNLLNTPGKNTSSIRGIADVHSFPEINFRIDSANIYHRDSIWRVAPENRIRLDSNYLAFSDFKIWGAGQAVQINGAISKQASDSLTLEFDKLDISSVDMLFGNEAIDLDGILNGSVDVVDVYNHPNFISNLKLNQLYFNKVKFGDASINTSWNELLKSLNIESQVVYTGNIGKRELLGIRGFYYPMEDKDNIHLEIDADKIDINILEPFFAGLVSNLNGKGTGKLFLDGSISEPELTGEINLIRSGLRVDYLNTYYTFTNPVKLEKDFIWFDQMILNDSLGNSAICDGKIFHNHFNDFRFDIAITPRKFNALNTTLYQNDLFYGQAFASGLVTIKGPMEEIIMDANVISDEGTEVFIPVNYAADVSENDYITFIQKKDTTHIEEEEFEIEKPSSSFGINMQIGVNPLASVEIILPYQMGNIKASGDGDMQLNMSPDGEFSMLGDYYINKGSFLFIVPNILRRNFTIQDGGKIGWSGDPFDAIIDIKAIYPVRASLDAITENDPELAGKRVDVNCIISLKNQLFNPDISFQFEIPNASPNIKDKIFNAFDTTSVAEVNRQIVSLLVLNSFASSGSGLATPSVGGSTMDILSNQLSGWISSISDDFDVAFSYRQGDEITSEELEVALSTQLFNNRVTIDGNFGVQQGVQASQNTSNIVGDVNIEYKVTPDGRIRLKAFNRTNEIDLIDYEAPYTQGVGVFYRKDFDHFGDLFKRKNKKAKKNSGPVSDTPPVSIEKTTEE